MVWVRIKINTFLIYELKGQICTTIGVKLIIKAKIWYKIFIIFQTN